jgi:hypothetical protein
VLLYLAVDVLPAMLGLSLELLLTPLLLAVLPQHELLMQSLDRRFVAHWEAKKNQEVGHQPVLLLLMLFASCSAVVGPVS